MYDKANYEENGNWPEDVKPITDECWEKFSVQGPPGKTRGANKDGMPCWVDIAPPTREEQIEAAERKKALLMADATKTIGPLQDAMDLGIATEKETARLKLWKTYRVQLNRINPQDTPCNEWPKNPE